MLLRSQMVESTQLSPAASVITVRSSFKETDRKFKRLARVEGSVTWRDALGNWLSKASLLIWSLARTVAAEKFSPGE